MSWYSENARSLENTNPKNKLPARYADAARTPLAKVTVAAGPNELSPFVLTAK